MKRLLIVTLSFTFAITTAFSATPIKRTIAGVPFGASVSQVLKKYPEAKRQENIIGWQELAIYDIAFAGEKWDIVSFTFRNRRMYQVHFLKHFSEEDAAEYLYNELSIRLLKKYKSYYQSLDNSSMCLFYDNQTTIGLSVSSDNVHLDYKDDLSTLKFDKEL